MSRFSITPDAERTGTSLQTEVAANFRTLLIAFGPPVEADAYKVSTEWVFTDDDGQVVTLYDYKETSLYDEDLPSVDDFRAQPSYDWHVGARNRAVADRFVQWIQKRLAIA